jgi:AAA domain-containing protein
MSDETITMPDLLIEGLLPKAGLVLIAGRPKDGKSWFACQLGLSVVTGSALGGWLRVKRPGRVHLWSLEDGFALTKDKIAKLLDGSRPDSLRDLRVYPELPAPILRGGDDAIRRELDVRPADVIILDSLFKLAGGSQPRTDICQADYSIIDRVRKVALERNCVAVIIMHTKKGARGGNPIENATGTSGTTAAADSVAELKRTSAREGKLTVVGRLVPQEEFAMEWNGGPEQWGWTITGDGQDAALGETSLEILAYLEAQGACKPSSIASGIGRSFSSVWSALTRLQERGKVVRGRDKKWELSTR